MYFANAVIQSDIKQFVKELTVFIIYNTGFITSFLSAFVIFSFSSSHISTLT